MAHGQRRPRYKGQLKDFIAKNKGDTSLEEQLQATDSTEAAIEIAQAAVNSSLGSCNCFPSLDIAIMKWWNSTLQALTSPPRFPSSEGLLASGTKTQAFLSTNQPCHLSRFVTHSTDGFRPLLVFIPSPCACSTSKRRKEGERETDRQSY